MKTSDPRTEDGRPGRLPELRVGQKVLAIFTTVPKCKGRIIRVNRAGVRWIAEPGKKTWNEPAGELLGFTVELEAERFGKKVWDLPPRCYRGPWDLFRLKCFPPPMSFDPVNLPPPIVQMPCSMMPVTLTDDELEDGPMPKPSPIQRSTG